jgi:hypothetical protein
MEDSGYISRLVLGHILADGGVLLVLWLAFGLDAYTKKALGAHLAMLLTFLSVGVIPYGVHLIKTAKTMRRMEYEYLSHQEPISGFAQKIQNIDTAAHRAKQNQAEALSPSSATPSKPSSSGDTTSFTLPRPEQMGTKASRITCGICDERIR